MTQRTISIPRGPTFLGLIVVILTAALATVGCSAEEPAPPLAAGFAVQSIAADATQLASKKVYMGAYGLPFVRHATGVHDVPYARAVALQSHHEALVMIVLDAPVLSEFFIRDVSKGVAERAGLTPDRVLVGATHSHSAPDLMGLWGGVPADYRQDVVESAIKAGVDAWQARKPALLEVGTGKAKNRNRRGWGFTDDALVVLRAKDLDGAPLGALVNFAAHPIFLDVDNLEMSRDFCGYLVDAMEKELKVPVLYFNGAQGDVSPDYDGEGKDFVAAQGYGEQMAQLALAVPMTAQVHEGLVVTEVSWEQSMENAFFQLAEKAGLLKEFDLIKDGFFMKGQINATYFRLGTALQGVSFPGEATTRVGLAIKEKMQAGQKLFLGLTRATLGYFVRADEWKTDRNGNYEESISPSEQAAETAISNLNGLISADVFTAAP